MKPAALFLFAIAVVFGSSPARSELRPRDWPNPLIEAIKKGDTNEVKAMLAQGLQDSDRCRRGESAVAVAAERGNLEIVKALFAAGARLIEPECSDSSPLWEASQQGHAEVVELLLSMKADMNFRVGNGSTPLLAAIAGPLIEEGPKGDAGKTAQLLLDAGSDPNVENELSQTPLILAVQHADARIVRLLLQHGALPDRRNENGDTPLSLAKKEKLDFIASLLEGKKYPRPAPSEQQLLDAAAAGDAGTVSRLLAAGTPADVLDDGGNTPLIHAAYNGKEEAALMLLKAGAAPLVKNGRNDTALHFAGARGLPRLAAALIAGKANPKARDFYGNSSLAYAVREGKAETAALLLAHGADPEEKDEKGVSLLMEMAAKNDAAMVRALLAGKASHTATDRDGLTALMHAAKEGSRDAVEALLEAGANPSAKNAAGQTALHFALEARHTDIVALLGSRGAKPDQAALITAIRSWEVPAVAAILKQGVSPHPVRGEEIPLLLAAGAYQVKGPLTELLLKAGAKPNVADSDGITPLMAAAKFPGEDSVAAVKLLLKAGADHRARDKKGLSAWTHAMLNGTNDTAEALAAAGAAREYATLAWEGSFVKDSPRFAKALTNQKEWDEVWKKLDKDPGAPIIDFKEYAVACVFLGRISGPYTKGVDFREPRLEGTTLQVDYAVGPRGYITDVSSTSPYAIKVVRRSGAENIVLPALPDGARPEDDGIRDIIKQLENPVE